VNGGVNISSGGITLIRNMPADNGKLLAPDFNTVAPRHMSLPNVGEGVQVSKIKRFFHLKWLIFILLG